MINTLPPLEEFLALHIDEIEEIISFTKVCIEPSAEQLNSASAEINQKLATMRGYLIDVEWYLIGARAEALKSLDEDMGPTAAKVHIESKTKDLKRLRDRLRGTVSSLKEMNISLWGIRKGVR